jgi:hypothetical protein
VLQEGGARLEAGLLARAAGVHQRRFGDAAA